MKLFPDAIWIILFCLFLPVFAQQEYKVRDLDLEGANTLAESKLLEEMSTTAVGYLSEYLLGEDPFLFSRDILNADIERLLNLYRREGFLDARIKVKELKADDEDETVEIILAVEENQPFKVDSVFFSLNGEKQRVDSVLVQERDELLTQPGERFRDENINKDLNRLLTMLANANYADAQVEKKLHPDARSKKVTVEWIITSGRRHRFGEIIISGNERIPEALILRQVAFEKDTWYQRRLIERSQEQVYQLGVFSVASLRELPDSTGGNVVPVEVTIREAPQWRTKLGVGYGREDAFRVFSDARYLGFLGGARRLDIYVKHSGLEPYNIDLKMTRPSFFTPRTNLVYDVFARRQEEPGFRLNRTGGSAGAVHQFARNLSVSASYIFEQVDLDTTSLAAAEENKIGLSSLYNKSSVIFGFSFNNAFPFVAPANGYKLTSSFKVSGLGFNSSYNFQRLLIDYRQYQPLNGAVLAWRVKGGAIISGSSASFIPVEDRFFSGGSQSVRGWLRGDLGPQSEDGVPIGGKSLVEGNLEYRFPVYKIVSAVLFLDGGNVWSELLTWRPGELRYAAGAGLRVKTPIGPARLDVARPVWDTRKHWQLHVSVGQAF